MLQVWDGLQSESERDRDTPLTLWEDGGQIQVQVRVKFQILFAEVGTGDTENSVSCEFEDTNFRVQLCL